MTKHVLFVDDEERILDGLKRSLNDICDDWKMEFALSAEDALGILRQQPVDAIVTDLRMPGMDGLALLDAVRARWPSIPRIVLTAHVHQKLVFRIMRYAHDVLLKPCSSTVVADTVSRWLSLHDNMGSEPVQKVVLGLRSLPLLPQTYATLKTRVASSTGSETDLLELAKHDISLACEMFRYAAKLSRSAPTTSGSPQSAVTQIGLRRTKELLGTDALECFSEGDVDAFGITQLNAHSVAVGQSVIAAVAQKKGDDDIDAALTAGLLHDIGKVALMTEEAEAYKELHLECAATRRPLHKLEEEHFGTTHAEIGSHLLATWGLGSEVIHAVRMHHTSPADDESDNILRQALYAANATWHKEHDHDRDRDT
jgi:putative nucleotidyltransferase with HDIG domain